MVIIFLMVAPVVGELGNISTGSVVAFWADSYGYSLINNGTEVEITGYAGSGGNLTIPGSFSGVPVTTIGEEAFSLVNSMISISIPAGVTSIGPYAFMGCKSLILSNIPSNVTTIGSGAFDGCTSLTSLIIPGDVKTIENWNLPGMFSVDIIILTFHSDHSG